MIKVSESDISKELKRCLSKHALLQLPMRLWVLNINTEKGEIDMKIRLPLDNEYLQRYFKDYKRTIYVPEFVGNILLKIREEQTDQPTPSEIADAYTERVREILEYRLKKSFLKIRELKIHKYEANIDMWGDDEVIYIPFTIRYDVVKELYMKFLLKEV